LIGRRAFLASTAALAACDRFAAADAPPTGDLPPLKIAPFPIGAAVRSDRPDDPAWLRLALRNLDQITPEWEMKMEAIVGDDGAFDFTRADRLAAFARDHGLRLHGHALIWYSQDNAFFRGLPEARFGAEYDRYIAAVAGRYRGQATSWDVVNEPVSEDGTGLRDCLWSHRLGLDGYMIRAFEQARAADPEAVLFLNDYNLENIPAKGATFLKTVERLLKAGAPIGGLGTQSHLDIESPAGQIRAWMRDAGSLGLPIHVSELDASQRRDGPVDLRTPAQRREQQVARVTELAEAFMALPERQRFAFTVWGLRDTDSWLRQGDRDDGRDSPLPFDAAGRPNPMAQALVDAFT
jgi:endo-1,4-beta-xylanase